MKRVMISLPRALAEKVAASAAKENRSVSNFLAILIEKGIAGSPAAELRALGGDPEVALKAAIAGLVRADLSAPSLQR